MGVPFSTEVKTAVDLATDLKSHATTALYTLVFIAVIAVFLFALFLLLLLALLISVNPDLAEERRAYVTPVVRCVIAWLALPVRAWGMKGLRGGEVMSEEPERESEERKSPGEGARRRRGFAAGTVVLRLDGSTVLFGLVFGAMFQRAQVGSCEILFFR